MTDKIQVKTSDLLSEDFDNFMARATRQRTTHYGMPPNTPCVFQHLMSCATGRRTQRPQKENP
jgi:hypothetical protein